MCPYNKNRNLNQECSSGNTKERSDRIVQGSRIGKTSQLDGKGLRRRVAKDGSTVLRVDNLE